jgi:serine/threonine-protein kinase
MSVPLEQFVKHLEDSGIIAGDTLKDFMPPQSAPKDAADLARELVRKKKLTKFQAQEVYRGKGKSLVLGSYTILDKIGAGGMGQVFKAQHRRMKRIVAVKMLPAAMMKDPAVVARFEREVTAAARLNHPNIVTAFDADNANGVHLLVMEYVEGTDLSAVVKKNGPLPVELAVNNILQTAQGLEAAHAEGIVHRDIKPANLLLDKSGTVKILDMGLARLDDQVGKAELTSTGIIMGTVDYMAPEQALNTKGADARADIYSLGCSLYYLLTAKAIYDGDTLMAKLLAHRDQPIPSLQAIRHDAPEQVEVVFRRMVAKHVDDRYQTMAEVISDLEACLSGRAQAGDPPSSFNSAPGSSSGSSFDEGLTDFLREDSISPAARVSAPKLASPTSKNKKWLLIGGGALGALLLVGLAIALSTKDKTPVANVSTSQGQTEITERPERPRPAKKLTEVDDQPEADPPQGPTPMTDLSPVRSPALLRGIRTWTLTTAANRVGTYLASNPVAALFAVSNHDGGTRIFDAATGKLVKILVAPSATYFVAWSHDGKLLATAGRDNRVLLWDYASGRQIKAIPVPASFLAWSPMENVLAVATQQGVQFIDVEGNHCRPDLPVASPVSLCWAPDGDRLAMATYPGLIEVRRTKTGDAVASWAASEQPGMMNLAWSPTKDILASATRFEPVRIWNLETGKLLRTLADTSPPLDNPSNLAWSRARDELVVTVSLAGVRDRIVAQIYSSDQESPSRRLEMGSLSEARYAALSDDGRRYVVLLNGGLTYVQDMTTPAKSYILGTAQGLTLPLLSEQGTAIAFASKHDTSSTWGNARIMTLALDRDWKEGFRDLPQDYPFHTQLALLPPSGPDTVLALRDLSPATSSLDILRGYEVLRRMDLPQTGRCLATSPDGRQLAVGLDKEVAIVDATEAKIIATLPAHQADVLVVAWGLQRRLAVGYSDGTVRIGSSDHAEFVASAPFGPNSSPVKRIAWSPDGRRIGVIQWGGRDVAVIDSIDGRLTETVIVGEEPGNIVWPDDATIVARTPTCLKRWPVADAFSAVTVCEAPCDQGAAEFSSGGRIIAERAPNSDCRFRDGRDGRLLGTLLMVRDCRPVFISPEGHYSAAVDVDDELVYIVETEAGEQQTLTPREFARRFQWENDPRQAFPLRLDVANPAR